MHLYFHESEIGKNFPLSYCGIKKYTYLCTRKRESYWGNVNPVGYRSCYDEGKQIGRAHV